jgi:hypothetical protein
MNRYTLNDSNLSMAEVAKYETTPDVRALQENANKIQALEKRRHALLKACADGDRKQEAADQQAKELARAKDERMAEVKDALRHGRKIDMPRMIMIDGRISELNGPDDAFPCNPDDLHAARAELRRELAEVIAELESCYRTARDLAREGFLATLSDLETRYAELVRLQRECLESMLVQAAVSGAFFDPNDRMRLKQMGNDTRNPSMVKALLYVKRTAAMIDGNFIEGLHIHPERVLASADTDIAQLVKSYEIWGAFPVTPIASPQITADAMAQRVAEINRNRKAMGL